MADSMWGLNCVMGKLALRPNLFHNSSRFMNRLFELPDNRSRYGPMIQNIEQLLKV